MGWLHPVPVWSEEDSQIGSDQSQPSTGAGCFVVHTVTSESSGFLCLFYWFRIAWTMEQGIVIRGYFAGWAEFCIIVGEGHGESVTSCWPESWSQVREGSLSPSLFLECTFCPSSPSLEKPFQGCSLEKGNVLLRPSGLCMWLNPTEASIQTYKILSDQGRDPLVLWLPKASLLCNSPPN